MFTFIMFRGSGLGIFLENTGTEVARLKGQELEILPGYAHLQAEIVDALRARTPYGPAPVLKAWTCTYCRRQNVEEKTCAGCGAPR